MVKLTDIALKFCTHALQTQGLWPEESEVRDIIEAQVELTESLNANYTAEPKSLRYTMDTYDREWFWDAVSQYLIGVDWPTNGDSQETNTEFTHRIRECIRAKGWARTT